MKRHGFSMMTALMMMALLTIITVALLSLASLDRRRAVRHTRAEVRENCAFSGLTFARTYFANNFANWDTYLSNPQQYNPTPLPAMDGGWGSVTPAPLSGAGLTALRAARPELFIDFDGDGAPDVYIFIRDNYDEFPPTPVNFKRDNDQNVIVGAACISQTMTPRREDGSLDPDDLVMEGLLSFNLTGNGYTAQAGAGATGTGNLNN